jgi:hypothetical protein
METSKYTKVSLGEGLQHVQLCTDGKFLLESREAVSAKCREQCHTLLLTQTSAFHMRPGGFVAGDYEQRFLLGRI